jgi:hypothetical protein
MKIRQIKKTLSAIGLLLVIMLACVAMSLAQDGPPIGLSHSLGLQRGHAGKASAVDGYALRSGLAPQSGYAPISFPRAARAPRVVQSPAAVSGGLLDLAGVKPRKIALHLLDSILLI